MNDTDFSHIRGALIRMPYGALVRPNILNIHTAEDVVTWLDGLRGVLEEEAVHIEADRRELRELRADLSALRRIFGQTS